MKNYNNKVVKHLFKAFKADWNDEKKANLSAYQSGTKKVLYNGYELYFANFGTFSVEYMAEELLFAQSIEDLQQNNEGKFIPIQPHIEEYADLLLQMLNNSNEQIIF